MQTEKAEGRIWQTEYIERLFVRSRLSKVPTGRDKRHVADQRSHTLELWRELISFPSVERRALRRV